MAILKSFLEMELHCWTSQQWHPNNNPHPFKARRKTKTILTTVVIGKCYYWRGALTFLGAGGGGGKTGPLAGYMSPMGSWQSPGSGEGTWGPR